MTFISFDTLNVWDLVYGAIALVIVLGILALIFRK